MTIKRVPLTGTYNTRSSSVNALSSSSGIVGIGIVGSMIVGNAARSSDKDVRIINWIPITVPDEVTQSKRFYLQKRPGFVVHSTPATGEKGSDIHVWVGQGSGTKVITAFGHTNSTIYDDTASLGAITGRSSGITETSISGTATLVISSRDSTLWYYQASGSLTKVADADYPGNAGRTMAGTCAHLDGYPFQMDTGARLHNGDLNSVTAWTAGAYVTANAIPDIGVGCVRHRNTIIAFCKEHFEVFRNGGNTTGSPLSRVEELTQLIGCVSADAIAKVRDAVFFAGSSKQAVVGIYVYDGGAADKISTPEIDAQLTIAGPANITLSTGGAYGRHLLFVKASNTTFVYVVEEKAWTEVNSQTPLWSKSDGVTVGSTMVCYFISDVSTSGKVYVFNPASISYQDAGVAFTATYQSAKLDFGTNRRKFWHRMDVIGDRESSASTLGLAWYDDDYLTSSTVRNVDLSNDAPRLNKCGSSRRRSFTLTHSANTPARLEALEIEFEVCR
jgi:hypothetical protein